MSANVESMFYAGREKPWHGLGTQVDEAPTSADALRLAGLDWKVERKPIQVCGGRKVDNFFANVRSSDGAVLGVVSDRYQVVQNAEAFAFTDALIEGEVRYETAGSLMGGRKIWLLAKLPDREIVGDKTEPYLCFSNTHDGSGAIRVCLAIFRPSFMRRGCAWIWQTSTWTSWPCTLTRWQTRVSRMSRLRKSWMRCSPLRRK